MLFSKVFIVLVLFNFVAACGNTSAKISLAEGDHQVGKNYQSTPFKDAPHHYLPWIGGVNYQISAPPGFGNHTLLNQMEFAWDFVVRKNKDLGAEVIASVDGCIRKVKSDSSTTFGNYKDRRKVNLVVLSWDKSISSIIYPGKKIESLYLHLSEVYPKIKPGYCLKQGTPIGITGCTGWCTGVHLHYQVQEEPTHDRWFNESLPVQFVEQIPLKKVSVMSKNLLL